MEFTVLPVLLAWAALERVERHGPGSKITRGQVQSIVARMHDALNRDALAEVLPNAGADGEPA